MHIPPPEDSVGLTEELHRYYQYQRSRWQEQRSRWQEQRSRWQEQRYQWQEQRHEREKKTSAAESAIALHCPGMIIYPSAVGRERDDATI